MKSSRRPLFRGLTVQLIAITVLPLTLLLLAITFTSVFRHQQNVSGPGYYLADVPWVMYFYDEYGFHGIYWHNNFGTPMSRGCVTSTIDDAKWLYDWASAGTKASVHE